tara:strand:- start:589 stop:1095 length:507 start_codon:yes stop_codon:yes gene_type:complete
MKNILLTILMLLPFIVIGQESKLSDLISSQINRYQKGKDYSWITDSPLSLPRTSSLKNVTPKFEGVVFYDSNEVSLIGEYVDGNVIAYPTFGEYKIYAEKNIGQSNEEGIIIITTVGIGDPNYPHSPSGVDEGQKIVINYKIFSETEILLGYDNKRSFFYEIRYDQIK